MDLQAWFERATREVTQNGLAVDRISLTQQGVVWHAWQRGRDGWEEPDDWFAEFSAILNTLTEQWPARKINCLLVAETSNGLVLSQVPFPVQGKDRTALSTMNDGSQLKMMAETVEALQRAWEKTLNVTNAQLEVQSKQIQMYGTQVMDLLQYVKNSEEHKALEARRIAELEASYQQKDDPLTEEIKNALPGLIELGKMYAETKMNQMAKAAVQRVAEVATEAAS